MPERSAGLLVWRRTDGELEVFLVHPGGPFFARKDEGAWSIPKGLLEDGEDPLGCARRELEEETGQSAPAGPFVELGEVRLKSGKRVLAFAAGGELDPARLASNTFELEWPPRSGQRQRFPEVDRGGWFDVDTARRKLNPGQVPLLDRLLASFEAP